MTGSRYKNRKIDVKNLLVILFITTFCTVPWAIGGTYPFTRTALLAVIAGLLLGTLISCIGKRKEGADKIRPRLGNPKIGWLLLLGIGFTFFQSSHYSVWINQQLPQRLQSLESSDGEVSPSDGAIGSISVYPPATRQKLIDLLIAVSFFTVASVLFDDRHAIYQVLVALTALGVCLAIFGIIQKLTFSGAIYGVYELLFGGDPFGPFVNGNNAAGFLLMPLAAGTFFAAKMLINFTRQERRANKSKQTLLGADWFAESEPNKSFFQSLIGLLAVLKPQHLYFLSALALMIAGVVMTLSRGGMVALLVQTLVIFILIARVNWKLGLVVVTAVMVGGLSLTIYLDQSTAVQDEVESLADISAAAAVRLAHWQDAGRFGMENWVFGVGNGTYRYVAPKFQTFYFPRSFHHAESVFVETFVELGVVGLILIMGCLAFMIYYLVLLLRSADSFDRALGIAGVGCLVGQVTASFVDFGLYQAPNSIVLATMMGIVAGRACRTSKQDTIQSQPSSAPTSNSARLSTVALTLSLLVLATLNLRESYGIESARLADRKLAHFNRMKKRPDVTQKLSLDVSKIETLLDTAEQIRPDDSGVHALTGELKISQARVIHAALTEEQVAEQIEATEQEIIELESGGAEEALIVQSKASLEALKNLKPELIWSLTAPTAFHQRLRRAQRKSNETAVEIFEKKEVVEFLSDAYQEYRTAYELCPLLIEPQMKMAQLSGFAGEDLKQELEHINKALKFSFTDTQVLYKCGFLALNSGEQELAVSLWAKCLRNPHLKVHERGIINLSIEELPMKQLYERVLPQNPHDLIRIATRYFSEPRLIFPKKLLLAHTTRVIQGSSELSDLEENLLLAQVAYQDREFLTAIKHFKLALGKEPEKAPWRLTYALALIEVNEFDEAMRQLKICQLDKSLRQNQVLALINKIRRSR